MTIFEKANYLIEIIENAGFEAYQVGGCVRDFFMERKCDDIDITTCAKPYDLEKILDENNVKYIETGLKHGTVTAVFDGDNFEITTYRTDGEYIDNRHPENVNFVNDIDEDLSRRDFTINAIAYNPNKNEIVDLFGGQKDIENKIIKAVGDPDKRFKEDALRIMRAIRFSSTLTFEIEENTKSALFRNKELLKNVSAERIFTELSKLLLGDNVFNVLTEYKEILDVIIPELVPIFNCEQNTVWHIYDVYTHTAKTVKESPKILPLRLTMLLHDIGKPLAKTTDDNGVDHFKGHQKISADLAAPILKRFKISNELFDRVMLIIPIHDIHIGTKKKNIKKWLNRLGEQGIRDLIEVKRADKLGQNPEMTGEELQNLVTTETLVDEIIDNGEPYSVKDLKINGFDLINLGFKGKMIGDILSAVLEKVIDGELENEKETEIEYVKTFKALPSDEGEKKKEN
ncbi:MAG: CCA tRNA nucleotidyltransferase [Eubacterium sp.]|nr:CCA tRNA nucleotidyltransferase [Eubacterium sp.]